MNAHVRRVQVVSARSAIGCITIASFPAHLLFYAGKYRTIKDTKFRGGLTSSMEFYTVYINYLMLVMTLLVLTTECRPKADRHERHHRRRSHPELFKKVSRSRGLPPSQLAEEMREAINLLRLEAKAERRRHEVTMTTVAPQDLLMSDEADNESSKPERNCCLNGGTCIMGNFCLCPRGYGGQYCQLLADEGRRKCGKVPHGDVVDNGCTRCFCGNGVLTCVPQHLCDEEKEGTEVWTVVFKPKVKGHLSDRQAQSQVATNVKRSDESSSSSSSSSASSLAIITIIMYWVMST